MLFKDSLTETVATLFSFVIFVIGGRRGGGGGGCLSLLFPIPFTPIALAPLSVVGSLLYVPFLLQNIIKCSRHLALGILLPALSSLLPLPAPFFWAPAQLSPPTLLLSWKQSCKQRNQKLCSSYIVLPLSTSICFFILQLK